jgi:hypothetical protein
MQECELPLALHIAIVTSMQNGMYSYTDSVFHREAGWMPEGTTRWRAGVTALEGVGMAATAADCRPTPGSGD